MSGERPSSPLSAQLLGGFTVVLPDGSTAGPWERPVARRLVQLLLLAPGHQLGREQLAEMLFPNLAPDRAANSVSKALTMARAALHESKDGTGPVLDADRASIRIRQGLHLTVDVERLRKNVAEALSVPDVPGRLAALEPLREASYELLPDEPYAEWTAATREAMRRLQLDVLLQVARDTPPASADAAWLAVIAVDPANEEASTAVVRHYVATGQRDRAIRTYHRFRAALLDAAGAEPADDLSALLGEDLQPLTGRRTAAPEAPADPTVPVGREQVLDRLVAACERRDRPRGIAIVGPAGIGKSTVVRALAQQMQSRNWAVREVTIAADDRLEPYAGLRVLLDELTPTAKPGRYGLLDSLRTGEAPGTSRSLEATRSRLAEELVALLDDVAAITPLAVVVDDAHWMDLAQQALLARVVTGAPRSWTVVVVARSDEPQAAVPELPLEAPRIDIPPLPPEPMRDLVRTELTAAPDDVIDLIVNRSRGNAFFGLELAREWLRGGTDDPRQLRVPERIVELLVRRIGECTPAARQLVPVVALAGGEATYELVLRLGSDDAISGSAEGCMRALDELTAAHLLVETPHGLRLLHPLLRDAALTTINPIRRGALHRMLADTLESLYAEPLVVARHRVSAFTAARLTVLAPAAATAAFAAGQLARAMFANQSATELLRGGLDAYAALPAEDAVGLRPQAVAAWVTIAEIHLDDEDGDAAVDAARVAIALADTDEERAAAWAQLAGAAYRRGDLATYGATLQDGLASLSEEGTVPWARLVSDIGWWLHRAARWDEARVHLERALPVLEAAGDDLPLVRCLDRLALSLSWDDMNVALEFADRALAVARRLGDETQEAVVLLHRGEILGAAGRTADGLDDLGAAGQRFLVSGDRYMQSVVQWVTAIVLDQHGDPEGALAAREAEAELLADVGNQRNLAACHQHRAGLLFGLGRPSEAAAARRLALLAAAESGDADLVARIEGEDPSATGRVREG
jgi:DNA-binding SARP family transcriptional activator/tetratricopeptide (TPR) repeat protein